MDGIATFLLGGAVGVALGYLASRKKPHKSLEPTPERSNEAPTAVPPVVVEEAAPQPEPDVDTSLAADAVGPATFEAVAAAEAPVEAAVVEEAPVEEGAAEQPVLEEPSAEEVLEEPMPAEEPSPQEDVIAVLGTGELVAEEPVAQEPMADEEIEEAVDRSTEQAIEAPGEPWEMDRVESELEELEEQKPGHEEAEMLEEGFVDIVEFDTSTAVDASAPEMVGIETAAAPYELDDTVVEVEPLVETEAVAETRMEAEAEERAAVSPVDDLKARIEETRRRIRRELEQPFMSADEIERAGGEMFEPTVPVEEETARPELVTEEISDTAAPAETIFEFEEPMAEEPTGLLDEMGVAEAGAEPAAEESLDYEAMKSRIEVTRSRLKAKAFDAMMTGESALLGREPENAQPSKPAMPSVDSEIDRTIETGLREQEG